MILSTNLIIASVIFFILTIASFLYFLKKKQFFVNEDALRRDLFAVGVKMIKQKGKCTNCGNKVPNLYRFPNGQEWYCVSCCHKLTFTKDGDSEEVSDSVHFACSKCNKELTVNTLVRCLTCNLIFCKEHSPQERHGCVIQPAKNKSSKDSLKKKHANPGHCLQCNTKINQITGNLCKYCKSWYCSEHLQPELHKCKGKLNNPHKFAGRIKYHKHGSEYYTE